MIYRKREADQWRRVPGSFLHRVLGEGRVLAGADLSETARILLKKAEEDAIAVREFAANPEIGDSIIGFHAQQAVEKWLKAVTRQAASGTALSTTSTA